MDVPVSGVGEVRIRRCSQRVLEKTYETAEKLKDLFHITKCQKSLEGF